MEKKEDEADESVAVVSGGKEEELQIVPELIGVHAAFIVPSGATTTFADQMLLVKRSFAKQSIHEQNTQHTAECAHVHAAHVFSFVLTTMAYTRCLHSKKWSIVSGLFHKGCY